MGGEFPFFLASSVQRIEKRVLRSMLRLQTRTLKEVEAMEQAREKKFTGERSDVGPGVPSRASHVPRPQRPERFAIPRSQVLSRLRNGSTR